MTAADLLHGLRHLGVELTAEGNNLRLRGPASALTDDVCGLVRGRKEPLLSLLHGWPPRPPELAPAAAGGWPDSHRERWGRRVAELEGAGLDWRTAERRAFEEVRRSLESARGAARQDRADGCHGAGVGAREGRP
jgi:hypothetical protein